MKYCSTIYYIAPMCARNNHHFLADIDNVKVIFNKIVVNYQYLMFPVRAYPFYTLSALEKIVPI